MNKDFFVEQLNNVIIRYESLNSRSQHDDLSGIAVEDIYETLTRAKAAVTRIAGTQSEYYQGIEYIMKTNAYVGKQLKFIMGTISALKSDLENGYLKSLNEIIQSEVFANYLEMAEHLLNEGYKDPSAVIIGSTLESHLRELCKNHEIETELENHKGIMVPKKAETMNSELTKKRVYSSLNQKQITAWLGIRNSAAHAKYEEYSTADVNLMLQGVMHFINSIK